MAKAVLVPYVSPDRPLEGFTLRAVVLGILLLAGLFLNLTAMRSTPADRAGARA